MFVPNLTVVLIFKVDKVLLSTAHAVPTANYKRTTAPVWETAVPVHTPQPALFGVEG